MPIEKIKKIYAGLYSIWLELIADIILVVLKFILGIFANSYSLIADSFYSISDVGSSSIILFKAQLLKASKIQKNYTLTKEINLVIRKIISLFIFVLGLAYGWKLFYGFIKDYPLIMPNYLGLWGAIFSILVKEILFQHSRTIGKISQNPEIIAYGWHHRRGQLTSLLALLGMSGTILGGTTWLWLNLLAAIIICFLTILASLKLYNQNYPILLESKVSLNVLDQINSLSLAVPGVTKVGKIIATKEGLDIFVDMKIEVDDDLGSNEAEKITHKVKNTIIKHVDRIANVKVEID